MVSNLQRMSWIANNVLLGAVVLEYIMTDYDENFTLEAIECSSDARIAGNVMCRSEKSCNECPCKNACDKEYGYKNGWEKFFDAPAGTGFDELEPASADEFWNLHPSYDTRGVMSDLGLSVSDFI